MLFLGQTYFRKLYMDICFLKSIVLWPYYILLYMKITRFGFCSLCDNGIRSRSVPFRFGWHVLPYCPRGEEVPWLCVGEAVVHRAKRPHAKEFLFEALSLLPMGGEKNLEGMGEATVHRAKSLHTKEDNIMLVVNEWISWPVYVVVKYICDNLPYVRYYGFENYIVGAHRL